MSESEDKPGTEKTGIRSKDRTAAKASTKSAAAKPDAAKDDAPAGKAKKTEEIGGPKGPEPTRYGDWERGGICVDF